MHQSGPSCAVAEHLCIMCGNLETIVDHNEIKEKSRFIHLSGSVPVDSDRG